jgi:hypothetical protein
MEYTNFQFPLEFLNILTALNSAGPYTSTFKKCNVPSDPPVLHVVPIINFTTIYKMSTLSRPEL